MCVVGDGVSTFQWVRKVKRHSQGGGGPQPRLKGSVMSKELSITHSLPSAFITLTFRVTTTEVTQENTKSFDISSLAWIL